MSRSILGHISRRSLHTILAVLVAGVVLFFAATRTQVGRDALARQLESRFQDRTGAVLSIERLTGNISQDLFASGVDVRSPSGVLLASADSVVVRPRWSSLLRREFSVYEVLLVRPVVDVAMLADSFKVVRGSAQAATDRPDSLSSDAAAGGWVFRNASLRIQGGRILGLIPLPGGSKGSVESMDLRTILSWEDEGGQMDLLNLQAMIPSLDVDIRSASAQTVFNADLWSLNQMHVETARSEWHVRGSMATAAEGQPWFDRPFQLEIEPSDVDFDELGAFLPSLPLQSDGRLAAYVSGPVSDLTVPWIRLEKGLTSIALEGTAMGYPGTMDIELSLTDVQLQPADLRTLFPDSRRVRNLQTVVSDFQFYSSGTLDLDGAVDNPLRAARIDTRSTFDLTSDAGLLSGTLSLTGSPADTLIHALSVRLERVNGYPWTSRARWMTSVDGFLSLDGFTADSSRFESELTARLTELRWGQRSADSLVLAVDLRPERIRGDLTLYNGSGVLDNAFNLARDDEGLFAIETVSRASDLDVGPIMGLPGIASRINAEVDGTARLRWDRTFAANVQAAVDSSLLELDGVAANVPPHTIDISVAPPSSGAPVLDFRSDMADVRIDSELSLPTLAALSQAWISAFQTAIDEEGRKRLHDAPEDALDPERTLNEWLTADAARERFPEGLSSASSTVQARLHSGAMLSALSPAFPDLEGSGDMELGIIWSADSLNAVASGSSDWFRYGAVSFTAPTVAARTSLVRGQSVVGTLVSSVSASADTLSVGGSTLASNHLDLELSGGSGTLNLSSAGTDRLEAVRSRAEWRRLPEFNLIRLSAFELDTGDGAWLLDQPASMGLYGDAITLDGLRIAYQRDGQETGQSLSAGGVFSEQESDSLMVGFEQLELLPLSAFMEWRRELGGLVNADLVLRGGYRQPRVTGALAVDTLSLDHHILGNATLQSNYVASRPEVAMDLRLNPIAPDDRAVLYGTDRPATILQNQLQVAGDVRLPGSGMDEDGMLNMEAVIDQADLFWLTYLFPEVVGSVSGYLSGDGRITGSFAYPLFNARLGVVDGRFEIPYTQTTYTASGTLRLDEEAIHFDPVRLEDGTGGRLRVDGRLLFNEYTSFTFDMAGELEEFQIMNVAESEDLPFYGFIWATGDISLTGPLFNARLVSTNGRTTANSELFVPINEETRETDQAFIVFEDTPGVIPDFRQLESRTNILQRRPTSERQFLDGLNLDLNIDAPPGSIVHLVIDPLLGDVINAVSTGNVQLILENDEFQVFGRLDVTSGDYQFTAGELFIKTFLINPGGFIEWSGDPINATLNIPASYRTRASRAGLPGAEGERPGVIPLIVDLQIGGTVESPEVDLSLSIDRSNQNVLGEYQALEALLNQPDRATEYATSVLILNSFQLTTENITTDSGGQLAFNSVSQLVTAQLNRFLESALPNVDFSLGLQGESAQDLDVTYGVALRLLNERLIIRGEGVYQGARSTESVRTSDGLQGEFVVEIRVGPRVSVEVFFRRESDILESTQLTNTAGVGLSYQTEFESWRSIVRSDRPGQ